MTRKHTPDAKPDAYSLAVLLVNGVYGLLILLLGLYAATAMFAPAKIVPKAEKIYLHTPARAFVAKTN